MGYLQKNLISFQNLLVVAAADGNLGQDEKDVLMEIGAEMGLTPEDLKPIVTANDLSFVLHDNFEDNKADLGDMLTIAVADGVIYDSEYSVCEAFAKAADISDQVLKELLEYAIAYSDDDDEETEEEEE